MADFKKVDFSASVVSCSTSPISYDEDKCIGCGRCAEVCQCDILVPQGKGKHPIVMYPGECYYCGCCVIECPVEGSYLSSSSSYEQSKIYSNYREQGVRK